LKPRCLDARVRELIERVIALSRSFTIWWELHHVKTKANYAHAVDQYSDFFRATADAHYISFFVISYQLFEPKHAVSTLPSTLGEFEGNPARSLARANRILVSLKPILRKVFQIRSEVYAHRSIRRTPEHAFAQVKLTALEMRRIVRGAQIIVAQLAKASNVGSATSIAQTIRQRENYSLEDLRLIAKALH